MGDPPATDDPARAKPRRQDYAAFQHMTTRWGDNDAYRHVNNVVYYAFFDTAVNRFLIAAGVLDPENSAVVGLVVETGCRYFSSVAFPDDIHAGLRVAHLGRSSVRYEVGLFRNAEDEASAAGHFVHVYVDRASQRPVPVPAEVRAALSRLAMVDHRKPARSLRQDKQDGLDGSARSRLGVLQPVPAP